MLIILMPAYNEELYIHDALRSIKNQEDQNFECWVIDDGSIDRTAQIVQEFTKTMSNLRLIQKPHTNLSDTLLYGGSFIASQDYIMMLDADDELYPNATKVINNIIATEKPDSIEYLFSGTTRAFPKIFNHIRHQRRPSHMLTTGEFSAYRTAALDWVVPFSRWNKVCSYRLWQELSQYYCSGFNHFEDTLFCFAFYYCMQNIYQCTEVLMNYSLRPNSMSIHIKPDGLLNIIPILRTMNYDTSYAEKKIYRCYKNLTEAEI